jgi:hypothetical protein
MILSTIGFAAAPGRSNDPLSVTIFECLASGIADYLAGSTLRDMVFELLADFGGNFVVQVVSELSHKLTACNHKLILLALVAK